MPYDNSPAAAADGAWNDTSGGDGVGVNNGFADDQGFTISEANVSKHAGDGDFGDRPKDGGCRICGLDSHFARDCPDKPADFGKCFNCGEEGHNKVDCPNPRVEREFTGTCNLCGQIGHRRADCPEKGPNLCRACGGEGHMAADCSENRIYVKLAHMGLDDIDSNEAWERLLAVDKEKEVQDIKTAVLTYAKAFPSVTFDELEKAFRDAQMNTYLIAKQQEVPGTHTIVNLQGKPEQKYVISFQFSSKPRRAKFAEGWPETPEDNMTRLSEAGFVMDSFVPKCTNCNEMGHKAKDCEQEKNEPNKLVITCANCSEEGHRARDCKQERKSGKKGRGCRNCGSEEHIAKDCDQPRNMDNVECKNCSQMGHLSKDCPDRAPEVCRNCGVGGHRKADCTNERVMQCRNCDEWGHGSRDCPKPFDISKLKCTVCSEMGHSWKKCPSKPAESDSANGTGGDGGFGDAGGAEGAGGEWDTGAGAGDATGGW